MAKQQAAPTTGGIPRLLEGTIADVEKLISQHFDLMRSEVKGELAKVSEAAASIGAGAGAATLGGVMGSMMAVHLLHDLTGMPLWLCYGLVGGALGAAGAGLLYRGAKTASNVDLVPRQTAEVVRRELAGAHA